MSSQESHILLTYFIYYCQLDNAQRHRTSVYFFLFFFNVVVLVIVVVPPPPYYPDELQKPFVH